MRDADCDPAFIVALKNQLLTTFGGPAVMARFRSSSNAEDAPGFSGAGLYESTNACLADDQDPDKSGPSRCDPAEPEERGLCRAVKKVWASLWLVRAYEEREWYGMDHGLAAMGVTPDQFERIIDGAMADHCHKTNPRLATRDDYREMLSASM